MLESCKLTTYTDVNKKRLGQLTTFIILNIDHISCLPFTHSEMPKWNYSDICLKHGMLLKTYTPRKIHSLLMNRSIRHRIFRLLKVSFAIPTHKPQSGISIRDHMLLKNIFENQISFSIVIDVIAANNQCLNGNRRQNGQKVFKCYPGMAI